MQTDAYLDLAQRVLREARHPMSAKEILQRAYLVGVVPDHLYGRTQHKTLTARLSVDILRYREKSLFFRPWPGRFFLSEFIDDHSIPPEYRTPIIARRRARHLKREYAAYLSRHQYALRDGTKLRKSELGSIFRSDYVRYAASGVVDPEDYALWNLAFVRRGHEILCYTRGRYKDGLERVLGNKTIGFCSPLTHNDRTLFDIKYHGVLGASISTVAIDLDLEYSPYISEIEGRSRFLGGFESSIESHRYLLMVCEVRIPKSLKVFTRRLAIKDLAWMPISEFKVKSDQFDHWSREVSRLFL